MSNVGSFVQVNFDNFAKVTIGQKQPILGNFEPSFLVPVCPASAFDGLFRKELKCIEIVDNCTEEHYDLVFGKFHFDSAHFILNEASDILIVSFPSEETLSTETAGEFVKAVVLHLVKTIAGVLAQ